VFKDKDLLGKYEVRGVLGRGAMGTVYDAWDPRLDRRVAIKTVRSRIEDNEEGAEALARFRQEARAAGRLQHPHIVGVYDYGETDAFAYIVMEFVEGRTLKSRLDEAGRLTTAETVRIMLGVLSGLAYSHARGVIHRDIKPANIMLTEEGEAKIADFGVARLENSEMTSVGTMIGTPSYMAPEQFLGEGVDARSDLYAAGVTLFHMLTGSRPYEGGMTAIMSRVLKTEEKPPRAAERVGSVSPMMDAVVSRAMAKVPADRFQDAAAFSLALRIAQAAPEQAAGQASGEANDEATIFERPGLQGQAQAAAPAKASAVAAPSPRLAALAGPVPAASPGTRKPPLLLAGGLAAGGLLAGGIAWFVLAHRAPATMPPFPSSPSPSVPALPPAASHTVTPAASPAAVTAEPKPVPISTPSPQAAAATIAAYLAEQGCVASNPHAVAQGIAVDGVAGSHAAAGLREGAQAKAAGLSLAWNVATFNGPYCSAVDLLRRDARDGWVGVTLAGGATVLRKDDWILPAVAAPGFPAYMRVDYLSHDGSVTHLFPPQGAVTDPAPTPPGTLLRLGKEVTGQVAPPYGTDMIMAISSSAPLKLHRKQVEPTSNYLAALHGAIVTARDAGAQVAGGAMVLRTIAR
jgi:serine/threonine-protein kinase